MKFNLVISLFVLFTLTIQAQVEGIAPEQLVDKISPQAPEAFNFMRYSYYPVDLSTGMVSVNIPIYTIKTKQLEFPISLSNHNSGIKVNDAAGSVGLGWTLNAGGLLSIRVNGKQQNATTYVSHEQESLLTDLKKKYSDQYCNISGYLRSLTNSEKTQSDEFSYYVPGHISGKFVYDTIGKLIQIPLTDNKIKIQNYTTGNEEYIVTAPTGIKYYFRDENNITPWSTSAKTGIYLSKIVSADNQDSIVFHYKKIPSIRIYESERLKASMTYKSTDVVPTPRFDCYPSVGLTMMADNIIEKITFNGGEVLFNSVKDRKDRYPMRINNITVNQNTSSNDKESVLICDLLNDTYFISKGLESQKDKPDLYHRLKLTGINIKSNKKDEKPQEYRFHYNSMLLPYYENTDKIILPKDRGLTDCYAQDTWGYFNGKMNNAHLILYDGKVSLDDFKKITGVINIPDKSVSEIHSKACSLEKITYPSGGYIMFDLESNRINPKELKGGLRVKRQRLYDRNHELLEDREYEYGLGIEVIPESDINERFSYKEKYDFFSANNNSGMIEIIQSSENRTIYQNNPLIFFAIPENPVFYPTVTEYQGGSKLNEGKKILKYDSTKNSSYSNMGGGNGDFRYLRFSIDNSWARGNLLEEQIYKKDLNGYTLIQSTINKYQTYLFKEFITGLVVIENHIFESGSLADCRMSIPSYSWFNTFATTGVKKQISSVTTNFYEGKALNTSQEEAYDKITATTNSHHNLTKRNLVLSDGSTEATRYFYPLDYSYSGTGSTDSKINDKLRDANVISVPIEIIKSRKPSSGGSELTYEGRFFQYEDVNRLKSIATLYAESPINYFGAGIIDQNGFNKSGKYQTDYTFRYDEKNNIKEVIDKTGLSTSYLWSYNSLYPVAEIKNATSEQIIEALKKTGLTYKDLLNTSVPDISKLETLLTALPNAMLQLFSYKPLVGVESISNPRGIKANYSYDNFGRLEFVKDNQGNIQEAYSYQLNPSSSNLVLRTERDYTQYRPASVYIETQDGSSDYAYKWIVSDSSKKILAQSTDKQFSFTPTTNEDLDLQCTITGTNTNKPVVLNRKLTIIPPPSLVISDITTTTTDFRVNGKKTSFDIVASEGSLSYTYAWTMKTKTKTKTSSSKDFSVTFEEEGTAEIECVVTDKNLQQKLNKKYVVLVQPPHPIDFDIYVIPFAYKLGDKVKLVPQIKENTGSGNYSWNNWAIKTPTGTLNSTNENFEFSFDKRGKYEVVGTLTDNYNKSKKTVQKIYDIQTPIYFKPSTQSQSGNKWILNSKIECDQDIIITCEISLLRTDNPRNNPVHFRIGSSSFTLNNAGSSTVKASLKSGNNDVQIQYDKYDGSTGREEVAIKIVEAPNGYSISGLAELSMTIL